jgi:hypothetical protein
VNPLFKPTPALDRDVLVAVVSDRRRFSATLCSAVIDRRYSQPPAAATIFAHRSHWARQVVSAIITLFIVSCANFAPPPEVSPALIANSGYDHADRQTLSRGRAIFVSRCLECHTLPSVTKHSPHEWPHLVSRMAGRANLSAPDQEAITVYLRAASSTMTIPR